MASSSAPASARAASKESCAQSATRGLQVTGASPDGKFVEIVELRDHPWFLGCQFHPEYKSRPGAPHPLFRSFIGATRAFKNATKAAEKAELDVAVPEAR